VTPRGESGPGSCWPRPWSPTPSTSSPSRVERTGTAWLVSPMPMSLLWTVGAAIVFSTVAEIVIAIVNPRASRAKDVRGQGDRPVGEYTGQSFVIIGAGRRDADGDGRVGSVLDRQRDLSVFRLVGSPRLDHEGSWPIAGVFPGGEADAGDELHPFAAVRETPR